MGPQQRHPVGPFKFTSCQTYTNIPTCHHLKDRHENLRRMYQDNQNHVQW
ncbi:hypothetical protein BDZ97DRAFT_1827136 [Flammula alnicola]|nr:hypothetical protein BDZ97DRAFT_1827136 [Flammula alnicola]